MTEEKQEAPHLPVKFKWFAIGVVSAFILVLLTARATTGS